MQNPFNHPKYIYRWTVLNYFRTHIVATSCTPAIAQQNVSVTDHYKYVTENTLDKLRFVRNKRVSGDKTGITLWVLSLVVSLVTM